MTTFISPERKQVLINDLVIRYMRCPKDFGNIVYAYKITPNDPETAAKFPEACVMWGGSYLVDNTVAENFGLKSGEITMVEMPHPDSDALQYCLITDSVLRTVFFPRDLNLMMGVEILSRKLELCQHLITAEQWRTFLTKVPSLVKKSHLLTESDLAYARGIAAQACPIRLSEDELTLRADIRTQIAYLCALLSVRYHLVYCLEATASEDDLETRLSNIRSLACALHDIDLPTEESTEEASAADGIQIVEV